LYLGQGVEPWQRATAATALETNIAALQVRLRMIMTRGVEIMVIGKLYTLVAGEMNLHVMLVV
jgi:hypothetical protein